MKIAIASGKGGTGKTTVAVSLGLALCARGEALLLDCDVEEPNCHLFLSPAILSRAEVTVPTPAVDGARCRGCGKCAEVCAFNAIAAVRPKALVFPELCHGCGACAVACPVGAISEAPRVVGVVERGRAGGLDFAQGILNVGASMATPVIRAVQAEAEGAKTILLDCPPGTACPMVQAVREADAALLVTEPTPFGLHDLTLAVDTLRLLGVPFGVAVNRAGAGDGRVQAYCAKEGIPVLLEIPEDRAIAEAYARGEPALRARPELSATLLSAWEKLERLAEGGRR